MAMTLLDLAQRVGTDEVAARIAHGDRIEQVSRSLRTALFNELRARAWPQSPSAPQWLNESFQARLSARRQVEEIPPIRWRGINLARIYAGALRQLDQEHRSARTLRPRSVEAEPPFPVPTECTVKLRELLTVSEYGPIRLRIRHDEMLV
jgi:hypothetical protein